MEEDDEKHWSFESARGRLGCLAILSACGLAFRQASGLIDRTAMRSEGERLVGEIRAEMVKHVDDTKTHVSEFLKLYFDPKDGGQPVIVGDKARNRRRRH